MVIKYLQVLETDNGELLCLGDPIGQKQKFLKVLFSISVLRKKLEDEKCYPEEF
jgi:hypothetical protein